MSSYCSFFVASQEDQYGLIVGLSVGIPLGITAIVVIGLFVCMYVRKSAAKR